MGTGQEQGYRIVYSEICTTLVYVCRGYQHAARTPLESLQPKPRSPQTSILRSTPTFASMRTVSDPSRICPQLPKTRVRSPIGRVPARNEPLLAETVGSRIDTSTSLPSGATQRTEIPFMHLALHLESAPKISDVSRPTCTGPTVTALDREHVTSSY